VTLLVDQVVERAQKLAQAYSFNPKVCRSISEGLDSVDGFIIARPIPHIVSLRCNASMLESTFSSKSRLPTR
jgi:hypothetical protein